MIALRRGPQAGRPASARPGRGASGERGEYLCHSTPVPSAVLTDGATADQLSDEAAATLGGASVPDIEPEQWRVLTETSTRVYLIGELDEPLGARTVVDVALYPERKPAAAIQER